MSNKLTLFFFQVIVLLLTLNSQAFSSVIEFPDFSTTSGIVLNGDANISSTVDGEVLRLTPAKEYQTGSVFSQSTVNASKFSTFFKFRISKSGGPASSCNQESGADGIVFIIQAISSNIGGTGGGIGYKGISNSVGIEFDTWCNTSFNDPNSNHLAILTGGSVIHEASFPSINITPDFDDGNIWYTWVDYDGGTLEVRINQIGVRPDNADLSTSVDVPMELGRVNDAYIGFSSGTGSNYGNHDIISWEYRDEFNPIVSIEPQACAITTLSPDLKLSIPRIEWNQGISNSKVPLSAEFRFVPSNDGRTLFELINYTILSK